MNDGMRSRVKRPSGDVLFDVNITPEPMTWEEETLEKQKKFRKAVRLLGALSLSVLFMLYWFVGPYAWVLLYDRAAGVPVSRAVDLMLFDPVEPMSNPLHASILMSDPVFQKPKPLVASDLSSGILSWVTTSYGQISKFRLDSAVRVVSEHAQSSNATCVCFAAFGLPYNIVYVSSLNVTLVEPMILREFTNRQVSIQSKCLLGALLEEAARRQHLDAYDVRIPADDLHRKHESNASGIVEYLTVLGNRGRKTLQEPDFPCVKYCVSFFQTKDSSDSI